MHCFWKVFLCSEYLYIFWAVWIISSHQRCDYLMKTFTHPLHWKASMFHSLDHHLQALVNIFFVWFPSKISLLKSGALWGLDKASALHFHGFSSIWTLCCCLILELKANVLPHPLHLGANTSVCSPTCDLWVKSLPHTVHLCCFSPG